jgi:hypothetical protein
MLAALLVAVVLTTAPSASPDPAPLKTIITVMSSPFCGQFATHVNAAIGAAVSNDRSLGTLVGTLRRPDLEGSDLDRQAQLDRLTSLADAIYHQYRQGAAQVAQLRALEATTTDPDQKAELKAADDALGGALYRQHLIQRDLDGFLAYLNAGQMRTYSEDEKTVNEALFGEADPHQAALDMDLRTRAGTGHPPYTSPFDGLAGDETPHDDTRYANNAAGAFVTSLAAIRGDELNAANHIETVSTHC